MHSSALTYVELESLVDAVRQRHGRAGLVTLALSALDATAGVEKMIVSEDPALTGAVAQDFVPAAAAIAPKSRSTTSARHLLQMHRAQR